MKIVIYKSKKILEVWEESSLKNTYPIAIGKSKTGHKEREGDMKTPEGDYVICIKNPNSQFHLSVGLNYPNNQDASHGLEKGQISQKECEAICQANNAGEIPPWKTALGGEIFIHGELEKQDWSEGCIRLYNNDIETLFNASAIGVKVAIKA